MTKFLFTFLFGIALLFAALVRLQKAQENNTFNGSFVDCRTLCAGTTFGGRAMLYFMAITNCHHCGKEIKRDLNQIKRAKFCFCSKKCKTENPDFNSYAAQRSGDVQRGQGEGKTYIKLNGRHMHRVVAEQKLGRPLLPGEIVHHIDGDKRNNTPENLQVLSSQSKHIKTHLPEMKAARIQKNGFARGETSGMSKLTNEKVTLIRASYAAGKSSYVIAEELGVSASTIMSAVKKKTWRHVA